MKRIQPSGRPTRAARHPAPERIGGRRRPRSRRAFGAFLGLAAALPIGASAQAPRLTVVGAGAGVSCAGWEAAGRSDAELEQWAFGFASALAAGVQIQKGGDPLAALDADAIHAWLGNHCRQLPDQALSVALVRMVLAASR